MAMRTLLRLTKCDALGFREIGLVGCSARLRVALSFLTVSALRVAPSGVNPTFGTVRFASGNRPALGRKRPGARRANCNSFRLASQSHKLQGKCAPEARSASETCMKALGSWIIENHRPHPQSLQPHLGPCCDERPSGDARLAQGGRPWIEIN